MQIPADWLALMRVLASKTKQPTLWWMLDLVAREAVAQGLPHPKPPWEPDAPGKKK